MPHCVKISHFFVSTTPPFRMHWSENTIDLRDERHIQRQKPHLEAVPPATAAQWRRSPRTLGRTSHNTVACHEDGVRFTPVVVDGHASGWRDSARTLISQRLSATSHRTRGDINLDLAQRISSSPLRVLIASHPERSPRIRTTGGLGRNRLVAR